ncbi:MAG: hypothetical protein M5R36_01940 [Deltaproteobacteria bacterium]|nr:hypothetical protein [Deltaproteobacteria bacterium]
MTSGGQHLVVAPGQDLEPKDADLRLSVSPDERGVWRARIERVLNAP